MHGLGAVRLGGGGDEGGEGLGLLEGGGVHLPVASHERATGGGRGGLEGGLESLDSLLLGVGGLEDGGADRGANLTRGRGRARGEGGGTAGRQGRSARAKGNRRHRRGQGRHLECIELGGPRDDCEGGPGGTAKFSVDVVARRERDDARQGPDARRGAEREADGGVRIPAPIIIGIGAGRKFRDGENRASRATPGVERRRDGNGSDEARTLRRGRERRVRNHSTRGDAPRGGMCASRKQRQLTSVIAETHQNPAWHAPRPPVSNFLEPTGQRAADRRATADNTSARGERRKTARVSSRDEDAALRIDARGTSRA